MNTIINQTSQNLKPMTNKKPMEMRNRGLTKNL